MSPYVAEFTGTLLLILLGEGVVAGVLLKGTKSENAGWLTVVVAWGLSVSMAVFFVGKFSGAHLNPAVTIGLAVEGSFPWKSVFPYVTSQLAGAFCGAAIVWLFYYPHWAGTSDSNAKLAVFCTGPAIRSTISNLFSEFAATFVLVIGILFLGPTTFAEGLKPLVIGLLVIVIGLSLGGTTGFAINPARDLGPRLAHFILPIPGKRDSDWRYSWIPVLGPILGGITASLVYKALV